VVDAYTFLEEGRPFSLPRNSDLFLLRRGDLLLQKERWLPRRGEKRWLSTLELLVETPKKGRLSLPPRDRVPKKEQAVLLFSFLGKDLKILSLRKGRGNSSPCRWPLRKGLLPH